VSFSAFLEQKIWFLVQGFEVRNFGKNQKIICALCSRVIFATMSNRKDENLISYIAALL
jgi:hypothetical protein